MAWHSFDSKTKTGTHIMRLTKNYIRHDKFEFRQMSDLQNSKGFLFIKYVVFYLSNVKLFVTRTLSHELSPHALFSISLQLVSDTL